ncbi:hypothetical protein B0H66DRAFT_369732 [Apodospora peruviana]|uniref:Uncharacterized protein n=1 Tax=Apodospora peruviana TaxID=516989 RepID=A0AAE0M057_9PEZI|nr:hypothetical protein B0H66DRAFT_369732 [Apodospora peruviana]
MSLSTSPSAPTTAPLLSFTTPFTFPSGTCTELFTTTLITSSFWFNEYSTTTLEVTVSDTADKRFAGCQPRGWENIIPASSRFSFVPAVCPSGWTMYGITGSPTFGLHPPVSTAYCCDRDYYLGWPFINDPSISGILRPACFKEISRSTEFSPTMTSAPPLSATSREIYFADGMQVHNAWHISWQKSDTSTLSPRPPDLDCTFTMDYWVPGEPTNPPNTSNCQADSYNSGVKWPAPSWWFLIIGLPLILIAITVLLCCFFYRRHKKRRLANGQTY